MAQATLNIKITYNGAISEVRIKGNTEEIPTAVDGVYTINKTIEENGTYTVVVKDKEGNYKYVYKKCFKRTKTAF